MTYIKQYNVDWNGDDGFGDACEIVASQTFDTVSTPCVNLIVSDNGNFARQGSFSMTLDYDDQGDCEGVYMYDGTPLIVRDTGGGNYAVDDNLFGSNTFRKPLFGPPGEPTDRRRRRAGRTPQ